MELKEKIRELCKIYKEVAKNGEQGKRGAAGDKNTDAGKQG